MLVWLISLEAHADDVASVHSVDVINGGLIRATKILCARFGVGINYEGVPLDVEGYGYRAVVDRDGNPGRLPLDRGLVFTYPAHAPVRVALDAAVAAANVQPDAEARFSVREAGGVLSVVPTEVRLADGSFAPYAPLLDTVVTLDSATGTPTALYHDLLAKLDAASDVPLFDVLEGYRIDKDQRTGRTVTLPSTTGAARDLMDAILLRSVMTRWTLIYTPNYANGVVGAFGLAFHAVRPTDDNVLNRTPLVGPPIGPIDFVPER